MFKFSKVLALSAIALFAVATASADTMVVNCSVVGPSPTELGGNISCAQFNLTGLSSIQITVNGTITGTITLTNNGAQTQTGRGTTTSDFDFGPLAGFTIASPFFTASFNTGNQSLLGGQTISFPGLSNSQTGSLGVNTTTFAPYSGAGNFLIPVSTLSGIGVTGGGGQFAAGQATQAAASAVVTYTYSTIPEPSTFVMLGLGACLLGFVRRRK